MRNSSVTAARGRSAAWLLVLASCRVLPPGSDGAPVADDSDAPSTNDTVSDTDGGTLAVAASSTEVTADGVQEITLTLVGRTADGAPVADDLVAALEVTRGSIASVSAFAEGVATATWRAGTLPGEATLSAPGWEIEGDRSVTFAPGTPFSAQLHLHGSLSEGTGTMMAHAAQAVEVGVDLLWWTDHDMLYFPEPTLEIAGVDFETGAMETRQPGWPSTTDYVATFEVHSDALATATAEVTGSAAHAGDYGLQIAGTGTGSSDVEASSWTLKSPIHLNYRSLIAQVDLSFALRPVEVSDTAELWIEIPLSATQAGSDDPDERARRIYLYHATTDYSLLTDAQSVYVPIDAPLGEWTEVSVDLSALARDAFPTVGEDLHAELVTVTIRAREDGHATYDLDDMHWSVERVGEELRDAQLDYLAGLGDTPDHFAGAELSLLDDGHFNAYGGLVPFLPYGESDDWDGASSIEFVHENGGIASYNHMFGVSRAAADEAVRAEKVSDRIETLTATRVFGADLLEVGYRERVALVDDFLEGWDALSVADIFVTGIGSSDFHNKESWTARANNFVTWIPADALTEEDLIPVLRRGQVWFGDPTYFADGHVDVSLEAAEAGAVMGQIAVGETEPVPVAFAADPLTAGWTVRWVEDGVVVAEETVDADGAFQSTRAVDPQGGRVVRVEVHTDEDDGALYTNPIYFVDAGEFSDDSAAGADLLPASRRPTP